MFLPHRIVKYKQSWAKMRVININILVISGETKFPRWEDYKWGLWVVGGVYLKCLTVRFRLKMASLRSKNKQKFAPSWELIWAVTRVDPQLGPRVTAGQHSEGGARQWDRYLTNSLTHWLVKYFYIFKS